MYIAYTTIWVLLLIVAISIPIGILTRAIGCLVSADIRSRVKRRPILHVIWLFLGLLIIASQLLPLSQRGQRSKHASTRQWLGVVEMATKAYLSEYGRFPLQSDSVDHLYLDDQPAYLNALCGMATATNHNPRRIAFLDIPVHYIGKHGEMIDDWQSPIHVIADWDMDGCVNVGTSRITRAVAVWSSGQDGKNDDGLGDDVISWK